MQNCKQFSLSSFNQLSVSKGNMEPQKRINEMEQEEQEDEHINAFDLLNNF